MDQDRAAIQQAFRAHGYAETTAKNYAMRVWAWMESGDTPEGYVLAGGTKGNRRMRVSALAAWFKLPENSAEFSAQLERLPHVPAPPLPPIGLLSENDVYKWLACIWNMNPRDYAVAVTAYSTGMRTGELLGIRVQDVDLDQRRIKVREGKGGRERVVPFGKNAHSALTHYLKVVRPTLLKDGTDLLFLHDNGSALLSGSLRYRVQVAAKRAGLTHVRVGLHILRHACASHLRQRGMDIRFIQALLGHSSIDDTARYLQFSGEEKAKETAKARHRIGRRVILDASEALDDTA